VEAVVNAEIGTDPQQSEGSGDTPWWRSVADDPKPVDLRVDLPHPARMYDYYLGGKDNFPADREAAEQARAVAPNASIAARANRAFMARAVRHLAGEVGIDQFLDIGTGIPTSPNLHEIAQQAIEGARVVYVDNDPIVLSHARALLTGTPAGRTAYLDADVRDVRRILTAPEVTDTLDLSRPVALSLLAVGHFLPDSDDPGGIVRRYVDALPAGSYLVLSHLTPDHDPSIEAGAKAYRARGIPLRPRTRAEVEALFGGLELLDPGLVSVHRWRPDAAVPIDLTDGQVSAYGAIGRKR
jgi:hypothetical protein